MVDPGGAVEIVFVDTAGAEVLAALVSEGIKEVARARTVSSLEGAGVEGPAFVPGVRPTVVVSQVCAAVSCTITCSRPRQSVREREGRKDGQIDIGQGVG